MYMDTAFFDHAMDQFPCVFDELLHAYPLRPGSGNITPPCRNFSWRMRPQHACGDQTWPGRLPPLKWRFLALQKDKTTFNLLWSHVVPLVLHFFGVPIYIYIHNNPGPETILITYNYKYIYIVRPLPREPLPLRTRRRPQLPIPADLALRSRQKTSNPNLWVTRLGVLIYLIYIYV